MVKYTTNNNTARYQTSISAEAITRTDVSTSVAPPLSGETDLFSFIRRSSKLSASLPSFLAFLSCRTIMSELFENTQIDVHGPLSCPLSKQLIGQRPTLGTFY